MGRIKQFTLRFDTDVPAEKEIMEYLKIRSESLGISKNTFLIQLLQKDMGREDILENSEQFIEKIAAGVAKRLSEVLDAVPVLPVSGISSGNNDEQNPESKEKTEELSEDAMDFLNCF